MSWNIQQPTCGNAAYQNKRLKIKHCLQDRPPMEGQQKKTHYPGWDKNTTRKGLWSGEDYQVPEGDRDA